MGGGALMVHPLLPLPLLSSRVHISGLQPQTLPLSLPLLLFQAYAGLHWWVVVTAVIVVEGAHSQGVQWWRVHISELGLQPWTITIVYT